MIFLASCISARKIGGPLQYRSYTLDYMEFWSTYTLDYMEFWSMDYHVNPVVKIPLLVKA